MKRENYDEEDMLIETRCKSCSEITTHTISTEDDEEPTRIQCSICDETREYRSPKSLPRKKASGRRPVLVARKLRKEKIVGNDYNKIIAKRDLSQAIQYEMTASFKKEELINHHYFGIGVVRRTVFPNKIDVLFSEGCKLLICASHEAEILPTALSVSRPHKGRTHNSKNPASWKPWSNISEEKKEHELVGGWDSDGAPE